MTARCRWVVVRDGKSGKRWQLVFPDGRVLKDLPAGTPPHPMDAGGGSPPFEDVFRPGHPDRPNR